MNNRLIIILYHPIVAVIRPAEMKSIKTDQKTRLNIFKILYTLNANAYAIEAIVRKNIKMATKAGSSRAH
jgi:hypothetical protein